MHCRQQARRRAAGAKGSARPRAVCRRRAQLCPVPSAAYVLLPVYQKLRKCASPAPQALFPAAGAVFPMDAAPMACAVRGPWRRPLPALFPSANAVPRPPVLPQWPALFTASGTTRRCHFRPPLPLPAAGAAPSQPAAAAHRPSGMGHGPMHCLPHGQNIPIVMIILFVYKFSFPHRPARRRAARAQKGKKMPHAKGMGHFEKAEDYSLIFVTTPEPTVRPPSRIAKRRPSSMAIGVISSTSMVTLSPGMHISVPSGRVITPVTSVVRK